MLKKLLFLISAAAVITASGCATKEGSLAKSDTAVKPEEINAVKIQIKPYSVRITSGHTAYFKVEGIDAAGKKLYLTADWKITEGKADTGSLNRASGDEVAFAAKTPGSITLVAEYNNHKATATIEVVKRQ